jgi:hypothetical protein
MSQYHQLPSGILTCSEIIGRTRLRGCTRSVQERPTGSKSPTGNTLSAQERHIGSKGLRGSARSVQERHTGSKGPTGSTPFRSATAYR